MSESPASAEVRPNQVRTLRMILSYDGTNYCGWQLQPNRASLQSIVELALSKFTGETIKVVASGRTDAGVHAIGQVISFTTRSTAPCGAFVQGLAPFLNDDIVVRKTEDVAAGFNARYDAKGKWYRYVIHNSPIRSPFLRNSVLWQRSRLDHDAMHQAVQHLIGTHDFRCFETQWPNRSSSVRTVTHSSVKRMNDWRVLVPDGSEIVGTPSNATGSQPGDCPFICFDIRADGFLYNMVRAIVGSLIHIGRGRWTPDQLRHIIELGDRTHAGETAPPQGLYLMQVDYE